MPGLAQCGRCKAWIEPFAGHRCGFLPYQDLDTWKAGPVSSSGTLPLVNTGKIADLMKDHEIARLRDQVERAAKLLLETLDTAFLPCRQDRKIRAFLNRLDAGEGGE